LEFNVPFQHKYGYIRDEWNLSAARWWNSIIEFRCHCFCSYLLYLV